MGVTKLKKRDQPPHFSEFHNDYCSCHANCQYSLLPMLRLFFIAYKSYQVLEERAWLAYLSAFPKHLQYRRTWYDETKSHTALGSKASVEGADQRSLTSPWKSLNTPAKYLYADMFSCSCLFLPSFHPSSSSSLSLKKSFGPVLYFEFLVQDMMK